MAQAIPRSQETLKKDETVNLIAASKVNGTKLFNRKGERAGEIEDIMIDKVSGHVAYAIAAFGGALGDGKAIAAHQAIRHALAEAKTKALAMRLMLDHAAIAVTIALLRRRRRHAAISHLKKPRL